MNKNTLLRVGELFTVLWTIIIFVLCLFPADDLPKEELFPNLDKVAHFTFYFVLSAASLLVLKLLKSEISVYLILLLIFLTSFLIEVLQLILPINRSFSLYDMLANTVGLFAGWLVFERIIFPRINID